MRVQIVSRAGTKLPFNKAQSENTATPTWNYSHTGSVGGWSYHFEAKKVLAGDNRNEPVVLPLRFTENKGGARDAQMLVGFAQASVTCAESLVGWLLPRGYRLESPHN